MLAELADFSPAEEPRSLRVASAWIDGADELVAVRVRAAADLLGAQPIDFPLTSNTYGHVLEQRQWQVARAMDAVLGG